MKKRKSTRRGCVMPFSVFQHFRRYIPLFILLFLFTFTDSYGQTTIATLPFELKINESSSLKNVNGLKCSSSLDFFYAGDGSVRFSSNSDYMIVRFDNPAKSVTIKKTTGGTGSTFIVSGSTDGNEYELIEELTVTATSSQLLSTGNAINSSFRYLKIRYNQSSNVGVSLLQIEAGETGTISVAPPSFSLPEGSYTATQYVSILGETGTTIYYTTDGSTPTKNAATYTGESIEIPSTLTLQAIAYDPEGHSSSVSSVTYTIINEASEAIMYRTAFYESFDQNNNNGGNDDKWSGSIMSSVTGETDHQGWSLQNGFSASKCIVLGTSSQGKGMATTPVLGISGNARLRFRAGVWNTTNEITACTLKISNSAGRLNHPSVSKTAQSIVLTLEKGKFTSYEVEITGAVESSSKLSFSAEPTSSKNARFFLDEIYIFSPLKTATTEATPSALSGKWDAEALCEIPELASEGSETTLVLNEHLELFDDLVIDNTRGNPNLLVYSTIPLPVINALNVVDGMFTAKAEIKDRKAFDAPEDIEGEVYLKRSFAGTGEGAGGWQSICLPFTATNIIGNKREYIPYIEWNKTQPKDKGFFWLKTTNTDTLTNDIDTDASTIQANTPYIIAFPNYEYPDYPLLDLKDSIEFTFYGNGIEASGKTHSFPLQDWLFQPTLQHVETENCYVLNTAGDKFEQVSVETSIQPEPFRPYLIYKGVDGNAAPHTFIIGKDNTPSGISELQNNLASLCITSIQGGILINVNSPATVSIHSPSGERIRQLTLGSGNNHVVHLPPGYYVVNGQKAVVF